MQDYVMGVELGENGTLFFFFPERVVLVNRST